MPSGQRGLADRLLIDQDRRRDGDRSILMLDDLVVIETTAATVRGDAFPDPVARSLAVPAGVAGGQERVVGHAVSGHVAATANGRVGRFARGAARGRDSVAPPSGLPPLGCSAGVDEQAPALTSPSRGLPPARSALVAATSVCFAEERCRRLLFDIDFGGVLAWQDRCFVSLSAGSNTSAPAASSACVGNRCATVSGSLAVEPSPQTTHRYPSRSSTAGRVETRQRCES